MRSVPGLDKRIRLNFDPKQLLPSDEQLAGYGKRMAALIVTTIRERTARGIFGPNNSRSNSHYNARYAERKGLFLGRNVPRRPVTLELRGGGTSLMGSIYGSYVRRKNGVTAYAAMRNRSHSNPFAPKQTTTTRELEEIFHVKGAGKRRKLYPFMYITEPEGHQILMRSLSGR